MSAAPAGFSFLPRGRSLPPLGLPSDKGAGGEGRPVDPPAFLGQVEGSSWSLGGWTHPPRSIPGMGSLWPCRPRGPAAQLQPLRLQRSCSASGAPFWSQVVRRELGHRMKGTVLLASDLL